MLEVVGATGGTCNGLIVVTETDCAKQVASARFLAYKVYEFGVNPENMFEF